FFQRIIHLPVPMLNAKTFLKLLQLDLNATPPGAPIMKVHLRIEPAKPRPAQDGLFVPSSPQAEKLELTLARINAIVGEGRAGSPQMLDTHRPQAFEMRRFIAEHNVTRAGTPAPPNKLFGGGTEPALSDRPKGGSRMGVLACSGLATANVYCSETSLVTA